MGDRYSARVHRRWRVLLVVASVLVSASVFFVEPFSPLALPLIAVQAAALWFLDARPAAATVVVLAASAGLQLQFPGYGPGIAFVVLCTYAWLRPLGESLWMLAPAMLAVSGPPVLRDRWGPAALWLGAALLAWSWGALARARGANRVAERRQAVLEERARIARELHDVLSHTVSVMVVQAAAADDIFELDPAKAREALRRTEQAGREALTELRGFLRTVREDDFDPAPQPNLADVDRLIGTVREAGLRVSLRRTGAGDVPAGVQLAAYRIVQEALTNTLRHARAATASVSLQLSESALQVRVRDDGAGGRSSSGGRGLVGMRERADLLGGTLRAGPHPEGGFEVEARLPW